MKRPNFNPRTREGCDLEFFFLEFFHGIISIHAPVKGATVINAKWPAAVFNFNPRTREGCDLGQFGKRKINRWI